MAVQAAQRGRLVAVIGDEVNGYARARFKQDIGIMSRYLQTPNTSINEIEECFKGFLTRSDIAIILINQNIAELIRHVIDQHTIPIPSVLEIPSKDSPYDPSKDSILRRAKGMFNAEDFR
ncbi:V-type proton ATPase subunit F-like [Saccoglossus kowalevskii]|uniref:V-type proton ATPase subunit F-like n=1 Tax=Saccoglossus kowalevskii TaxID=10224 RepID=A0ABM0GZT0_SACKO|nr:PREDICTED: V-type proton ATPase subunit F-like [Saccoglossus kowalevskii]